MNEQEGVRCPKYDKCATLMNVDAILYTVNTSFMKKETKLTNRVAASGIITPATFPNVGWLGYTENQI